MKEAATACMLGLSCGGLIGLAAWIWQRSWIVAGILTGAIGVSMMTACLLGVILPNRASRVEGGPAYRRRTDRPRLGISGHLAFLLHAGRQGPLVSSGRRHLRRTFAHQRDGLHRKPLARPA